MPLSGITVLRDSVPVTEVRTQNFLLCFLVNLTFTNSHQLKFTSKCIFTTEKILACCTAFPAKVFDLVSCQEQLKMYLHRTEGSNERNNYVDHK